MTASSNGLLNELLAMYRRIVKQEEAIRHLAFVLTDKSPAVARLKQEIEEILNDDA